MKEIAFDDLGHVDIGVGDVLLTGPTGQLAEEPINRAFGAGNMGGFRILGGSQSGYRLAVLYTTFNDIDWPDRLDVETSQFVYFGDNKEPGRELHDTPKHGNELLRQVFEIIHARPTERARVPPFFVVSRVGRSRDAKFHGLAAPGAPGVAETDDLVAIWKTKGRERFQNYRAVFTLLDVSTISAAWLSDLRDGSGIITEHVPDAWLHWVTTGKYRVSTSS